MPVTVTSPFDHQHPFPPDLRMQVPNLDARNSITEYVRWEGMTVYVIENGKTYQLIGGIQNSQWVEMPSAAGMGQFIPASWVDTDPTLAADSDQKIATQKAVKAYVDSSSAPVTRTLTMATGNGISVSPSGAQNLSADRSWTFSIDTAYLDTVYVNQSQKGAAGGVVPLDSNGKIPSTYLPPVTITETFVVASQAAMLALTAQIGDVAVRTDINKSFILRQEPASTLANWVELLSPGAPVQSVNGETGTVQLSMGLSGDTLTLTGSPSVDLGAWATSKGFIQSLSLGGNTGQINISGGNNVRLQSLVNDIVLTDAETPPIAGGGLAVFRNEDTATNFPVASSGSGFISSRGTISGAFIIWKNVNNDNKLRFRTGGVNVWSNDWQTFASEEHVAGNYVTLNTIQTIGQRKTFSVADENNAAAFYNSTINPSLDKIIAARFGNVSTGSAGLGKQTLIRFDGKSSGNVSRYGDIVLDPEAQYLGINGANLTTGQNPSFRVYSDKHVESDGYAILSGSDTPLRLKGTNTGVANAALIGFYENNATTRQGYLGFGSSAHSHMYMRSDVGANHIGLLATGGANGLIYDYSGSGGQKTVWHSGNFNPDDFDLQAVTDNGKVTDNMLGVKSGDVDFTTDGPTTFYGYGGVLNVNATGFSISGFDNYPSSPTPSPYGFSLNNNLFSFSASGPDPNNARLNVGSSGMTLRNKVSYPISGGTLINDYDLQKTQYRFDELIQITDDASPTHQVFMQRALFHDIGTASWNLEYVDESNDHNAIGAYVEAGNISIKLFAIDTTGTWQIGRENGNDNLLIEGIAGSVEIANGGGTTYTTIGPDGIEIMNSASGVIMKSPDGTRYRITVQNGGTLSVAAA